MIKASSIFLLVNLFILPQVCNGFGRILEEKMDYHIIHSGIDNALWIGTNNGLYRWKNNETFKIPLPENLNITAINSMNNTLAIGTLTGEVYTYQLGQKKLNLIGKLRAEISDIEMKDKIICITTKGQGFVRITPYEITHFCIKQGLPDEFIYTATIDKDHNIWTSSDRGINITSANHKSIPFFLNHKIPDRLITSFALKDSLLYCGTQIGDVCMINLKDSSVKVFDHSFWKSAQIFDLKLLDQSIVIATDSGAFLLDLNGNPLQTIVEKKSIHRIEIDKEANIWVCGNKVLASSLGEQITLINQYGKLPIKEVHTLIHDHRENVYFTPDQGLVKLNLLNNKIQKTNITNPSDLIDITSLYIDVEGSLWVGTSSKGLFKVDTSDLQFTEIPIDYSLETSCILNIVGFKEEIWVSTLNGIWHSPMKGNNYSFRSLEEELQSKKFYNYQVKNDSKNNLWLATDGQGVIKYSEGKITPFTASKLIKTNVFYSIEEDAMRQLWFNAYNDGLYCYSNDTIRHLTMLNGLYSNEIFSLSKYGKDLMIAVSSNGIDIINILDLSVSHLNLETLNFSITPEINSICSDQFENIYIGTNIGIVKLYLPAYKTHFTPQATIEAIKVMEKNISRNKIEFTSQENYFSFTISSFFNSDQPVYYRYQLKGLNENWNTTIDKEVVFPRLNPGQYQFNLQSSNNPDFFNATNDSYEFTVLNPFWKQSWFVILFLSSFIVGFYSYIRFREKRISRFEQLEKEKAIAEFETLKNQVSPHFLFNSFNTLIQVIDEDKQKAIEYTQMLSDFYRSLISYRDIDLVSLDEELILLDKYFYLQKMRFGDSLQLIDTCSISQKKHVEIPPLTLQLLAENAIKHNAISASKPLTILIQMNSHSLSISNNINEKFSHEASEKMGLQNIKNRFKLFSQQEVEIIKTPDRFEIKLPILKH